MDKLKIAFLLFVGLVNYATSNGVSECGLSRNDQEAGFRITGGEYAPHGAWPWIARLLLDGRDLCGASILNDRWILTAAHCLRYSPDKDAYRVVLGDHDMTDQDGHEQRHLVAKLIVHAGFRPWQDDIALVKLQTKITFSDKVRPICLADDSTDLSPGRQCWAAGWGKTREGKAETRLRQVRTRLIANDQCRKMRSPAPQPIVDTLVCLGDGSKGVCQGDSGGPLMCRDADRWRLVGLTSFGDVKCMGPGVFTRINRFKSWIEEQMAAN